MPKQNRIDLWKTALSEEIELLDEHIQECCREKELYQKMLDIAAGYKGTLDEKTTSNGGGRRKIPGSVLVLGRVWKTCEKCGLNQPAGEYQYKCRKQECKGPLRIWKDDDGQEARSLQHSVTD